MGAPATDSERITQLQVRVEELERSRVGWEADALNYAKSRGCQEEISDRLRKALEKIDSRKCERFRFVGNTATCIERDDSLCRSCIATVALREKT